MKNPKSYLFILLFAAVPLVGVATTSKDEQIKDTAESTYNYRTVLKDDVRIEVQDGVLILTGEVDDHSIKSLAEDTMESVPGVVKVKNQITVKPQPPEYSDSWIATKVRLALLMRSDVSIVGIDVAVENGTVTLHGRVDSVAQEELTVDYVRKIDGVRDIINRLTVKEKPANDRPMSVVIDDASITARVNYELLRHRSTSALRTNVTTKLGVVVIEGVAKNDAERTLVTQLAKGVSGVKSVENKMTVQTGDEN